MHVTYCTEPYYQILLTLLPIANSMFCEQESLDPLMEDLTKSVVSGLSRNSRAILDKILKEKSCPYDKGSGEPNIEVLCDLVAEYASIHRCMYMDLEGEIRGQIVKKIMSVASPNLDHHVRFLRALKIRSSGYAPVVTIFTTNYDILFELAACEVAGIRMETGFEGPIKRWFNPEVFDLGRGLERQGRFTRRRELHVNLIKLHGSVSWLKDNGRVIESGLDLSGKMSERVMVMPRREKVMDTVADPFDQLFTRAARILGSRCKYIVTCGFSFRDKHINDQLIFPKLQDRSIRMIAMCKEESENLRELKEFPSFQAGFPKSCFVGGSITEESGNLWKFSNLVKFLEP